MTPEPMSRDEMVRAMNRQGVSILRAEYFADQELAARQGVANSALAGSVAVKIARAAMPFPLLLTLPWTALCTDNFRERASLVMTKGKPVPRKVMDARYKLAREKVQTEARKLTEGYAPYDGPLSLVARVWVPGGSSRNDVCNFAKGVHDALQRIVYESDAQLHDVRWIRAGVDVDRPRAEIAMISL